MKWKITSRYVLSVLSIFFIIFISNSALLLYIFITQQDEVDSILDVNSSEVFVRSLADEFQMTDGEISLSYKAIDKLAAKQAWVQILDDNGEVVTSFEAPEDAPNHYSPVELVHNYKYMDDDLNTYFIAPFEDYSYLVVMPHLKEQRLIFMIDIEVIFTYIKKFFLLAFFSNFIVTAIIGFVFSLYFTRPINRIIEQITKLKNRIFQTNQPKRPGIYKQVFANLNDVATTLHQHEVEQKRLKDMQNEWISNVSHDIKTPLSSIHGYAELLQDTHVTSEERKDYAAVVERQSHYIQQLLDDFSLTLRLRNQQLPLQLQETNMEVFVRNIVIDLLNDPQFQDVEIVYEKETDTLFWQIDNHLMKRALLNFIYNALTHNEQVTVTVKVTTDGIIIADNGKGISEVDQKQIFERYYRGTNTSHIHGTGLGMAISRDIIQAHGGRVTLTSELGVGTVITIGLPTTKSLIK